jgi:hypothetical protein
MSLRRHDDDPSHKHLRTALHTFKEVIRRDEGTCTCQAAMAVHGHLFAYLRSARGSRESATTFAKTQLAKLLSDTLKDVVPDVRDVSNVSVRATQWSNMAVWADKITRVLLRNNMSNTFGSTRRITGGESTSPSVMGGLAWDLWRKTVETPYIRFVELNFVAWLAEAREALTNGYPSSSILEHVHVLKYMRQLQNNYYFQNHPTMREVQTGHPSEPSRTKSIVVPEDTIVEWLYETTDHDFPRLVRGALKRGSYFLLWQHIARETNLLNSLLHSPLGTHDILSRVITKELTKQMYHLFPRIEVKTKIVRRRRARPNDHPKDSWWGNISSLAAFSDGEDVWARFSTEDRIFFDNSRKSKAKQIFGNILHCAHNAASHRSPSSEPQDFVDLMDFQGEETIIRNFIRDEITVSAEHGHGPNVHMRSNQGEGRQALMACECSNSIFNDDFPVIVSLVQHFGTHLKPYVLKWLTAVLGHLVESHTSLDGAITHVRSATKFLMDVDRLGFSPETLAPPPHHGYARYTDKARARVLGALKNRNDFTTGIIPWLAKEFPEAVSIDQCDYAGFVGMLWGTCVGSLPESVVDEAVSHIGETLLVLGSTQVHSPHRETPLIVFLKSFLDQLDEHSSGSSRFSQISKMISDVQHARGSAVILSSAWPNLRGDDPPVSVPPHVQTGTDELLRQTECHHPEKQFSGSTWAGRVVLKWQKEEGGTPPNSGQQRRDIVCLPCVASVIMCLQEEKNQAMPSQDLINATNIPMEPLRHIARCSQGLVKYDECSDTFHLEEPQGAQIAKQIAEQHRMTAPQPPPPPTMYIFTPGMLFDTCKKNARKKATRNADQKSIFDVGTLVEVYIVSLMKKETEMGLDNIKQQTIKDFVTKWEEVDGVFIESIIETLEEKGYITRKPTNDGGETLTYEP